MAQFIRRRGRHQRRRHADPDYEPKHAETMSGVTANGTANKKGESYSPAMYDCFAEVETQKDHIIPRESLTVKQHLRIFPQSLEFEQLKDTKRQQTAKDGKLATTTDPRYRLAWKSDKTLLKLGKPINFGEGRGTLFKRITSHSKIRESQIEIKQGTDTEINIGLEHADPMDELETKPAPSEPLDPEQQEIDDILNNL